jgi:multidrug efflux pump subunit AcrA (membrane-fusion protein)
MGLWNWVVTQATGVDPAAEQARSNAADAGNAAIDQQLLEQGTWTQAQYDQAQADMAAGNLSTGVNDVAGSINQAAEQGLMEGVNNVLTAPGKAVGAVGSGASTLLGGILKNIPWWVYLGAAVALFIWMGGLSLLRGRLAKSQ